jgi:hypothetical protein
MSKGYSSRVADKRTVESAEHDAALMCTASGCPHRWSVDFGTRLCSAHNGAELHEWPEITQRLLDADTDAALRSQEPRKQATHRHFSAAEKKAVGQRLRAALRNVGGKDWARRLQAREEAGRRLSDAQKAMWRAALNFGETKGWPEEMREELEAADV